MQSKKEKKICDLSITLQWRFCLCYELLYMSEEQKSMQANLFSHLFFNGTDSFNIETPVVNNYDRFV